MQNRIQGEGMEGGGGAGGVLMFVLHPLLWYREMIILRVLKAHISRRNIIYTSIFVIHFYFDLPHQPTVPDWC